MKLLNLYFVLQMLEDVTDRLQSLSCLRLLSQTGERTFVSVSGLETGDVDPSQVSNCNCSKKRFEILS